MSGHGDDAAQRPYVVVVVGIHPDTLAYREELSAFHEIGRAVTHASVKFSEWQAFFIPPVPLYAWSVVDRRSGETKFMIPDFRKALSNATGKQGPNGQGSRAGGSGRTGLPFRARVA